MRRGGRGKSLPMHTMWGIHCTCTRSGPGPSQGRGRRRETPPYKKRRAGARTLRGVPTTACPRADGTSGPRLRNTARRADAVTRGSLAPRRHPSQPPARPHRPGIPARTAKSDADDARAPKPAGGQSSGPDGGARVRPTPGPLAAASCKAHTTRILPTSSAGRAGSIPGESGWAGVPLRLCLDRP